MITNTQVRAARALLNLGQNDIAKASGINPTQISAFERGIAGLSVKNIQKLYDLFFSAGVEFLPYDGVRMNPTGSISTLSGKDGLRELYDEIYKAANDAGGFIDIFNGLPDKIVENIGSDWYESHTQRMKDIKNKYTLRAIIQEGDTNYIGAGFATYKWWSSESFQNRMIYIFGSKVAFIIFDPAIEITIINEQKIADSQRALFETAWGNAEEVQ